MKYFGTDGIRQKADAFTPDLLNSLVAGLADYAATNITDRPAKVLLAGDTRESTEWILQDLAVALESLGLDYASAGVLPTPAVNFCFYQMGFDFAIDVTASHNPFTDNGIKIFERGAKSGIKLSAPGCAAIEKALENHAQISLVAPTDRESVHAEAVELYKEHILNYLGQFGQGPIDLNNLKVGLDCANGAMSAVFAPVFEALNLDVAPIHANADYGEAINQACGSTHPESLQDLVIKNPDLAFGIAFDGDGDRTLLVDETGALIDGDHILAILARALNLNHIALTVMANQGLLNWAAENQIKTEITSVGDANVAAAMKLNQINLGGEQSGHIILPGEPTGDGLLTALMVARFFATAREKTPNLKFSTFSHLFKPLPQVMVNFPATPAQKSSLAADPAVKSILLHFAEKVKTLSGRLLVRPSGTEPLIRITVWGDDEDAIKKLAEDLREELIQRI